MHHKAIGGSKETDVNELTVIPKGLLTSSKKETTETPVANLPNRFLIMRLSSI
jgi:hypothetical protein